MNVRYWPKADIRSCTAHVRFRGKADMARVPTLRIQTVDPSAFEMPDAPANEAGVLFIFERGSQ
jgi:hypothetical protein